MSGCVNLRNLPHEGPGRSGGNSLLRNVIARRSLGEFVGGQRRIIAVMAEQATRKRRGFLRREDGSVTVEFIVWMPLFLIIVGFIVDAATTYLIQASMWNTAMDCARRMSTGQYTTTSDVQTKCAQKELLFAYKFNPNSKVSGPGTITPTFPAAGGTDDTVEITLPMYEAGVFGVLAVFGGFTGSNAKLDVKATMKAEV